MESGLESELQKALNLPPSKIFKVCKPSSKYCKVGLSKLKIRMNHFFFQKEGMISGIDHHLLTFLVMLASRIHYVNYVVCWQENVLTDCLFCKSGSDWPMPLCHGTWAPTGTSNGPLTIVV